LLILQDEYLSEFEDLAFRALDDLNTRERLPEHFRCLEVDHVDVVTRVLSTPRAERKLTPAFVYSWGTSRSQVGGIFEQRETRMTKRTGKEMRLTLVN
jgi:hypothetical protein